jgi:hypothetical protein
VACFDDQEFESAVLKIAGIAHASVEEVRAELAELIGALRSIERQKLAKAAADQYRRDKIKFHGPYKAAITALEEALRGYLAVDHELRELLDRQPPELRLEHINAKLDSFRARSEKEARAAQWCEENRDRDQYHMDSAREAHLTVKAEVDREIERLDLERRSALSNPDTDVNTGGLAAIRLMRYVPVGKMTWTEDIIRNYLPQSGSPVEQLERTWKAEALRLLPSAPLEHIREEVEERLRALTLPNTEQLSRILDNGDSPKKPGRPSGAKTHMYGVREMVVHSLLDAARRGGGELTFSRTSRSSGTLWPALRRLSKCMPSGVVPKRQDAAAHRWVRTAYESWAK